MKAFIILLLFAGSITSLPFSAAAQNSGKQQSVKISGEVTAPLALTSADLQKFNQVAVTRKDRDAKDHTYSGALLSDILQKAGVTMAAQLKGENLSKYLWVEASDGYQVIFALAELDKSFTDRLIILADKMDGKPLPAGDGPFRIIVQDEKKPARCIKQVTSMRIQFPGTAN
jgi:DMSO/TMAO reductase YedYZ molybdopterin-dependent catalytic subunit